MRQILTLLLVVLVVTGSLVWSSETTHSRPRVGVGVIAERNDGKILMGMRLNAHGAGDWAFPGGHLEYGEGILDCAARELLEETGLEANSLEIVGVTNDLIGVEQKHYITLFVKATILEGDAQLLEPDRCVGWCWFTWEDMPTPLFQSIRSFLDGTPQSNGVFRLHDQLKIRLR